MSRSEDGADAHGDRLARWLHEQQVDDAATARRREGWIRQRDAEDGTLGGLLLDLAERERPIVIHLTTGRRHRGVVHTVGGDFIGVRTLGRQDILVRTAAIASVRPEPGATPSVGNRSLQIEVTLGDVLGDLAADRPRVYAVTSDGEGVGGTLRSAGRDLLSLRPDRGTDTIYLGLAAVVEVMFT